MGIFYREKAFHQWRSQYRDKRGQSAPLDSEKIVKNRERGKIGKKSRKNQDSEKAKIGKVLSLQMPLLTNRAGYVTEFHAGKKIRKNDCPLRNICLLRSWPK